MIYDVSCSIVAYKNKAETILGAVQSVLNSELNVVVYVYDNSNEDILRPFLKDERIVYIHDPTNIGFGRAHNYCINQIVDKSKFHLILNPDVCFDKGVLEQLVTTLEKDTSIGIIAPKVKYPDGSLQYSCRLLPHPFDLLLRRSNILTKLFHSRLLRNDLTFTGYSDVMDVPFLLGCFLLLPCTTLKEIKGFDEEFFIYMEDFDLVRRVKKNYKALFYPHVEICHVYERGSGKKIGLVWEHIKSAIHYFNKWGWFSDKVRTKYNDAIIEKYKGPLL